MIEGEGMGMRMIIPAMEIPSSGAIKQAEDIISEEQGFPVRLIFLNPEEVKSSKLIWQIIIKPKEKRTSEITKLMFRAEMQDAQMFAGLLNMDYLTEKFAAIWEENPKKLFKTKEQAQEEQAQITGEKTEMPAANILSPKVNLPPPEKMAGKQIKQELAIGV